MEFHEARLWIERWLNAFWKQLSKDLRMNLSYSSAYHPQTDGQTERINEVIEAYLRAFTNYTQDDWDEWLDLAEMAFNNSRHSATGFSPFFVEHGYGCRYRVHPRTAYKKADYSC
jgi:hypothetical protein